jgi:hypothetical protein
MAYDSSNGLVYLSTDWYVTFINSTNDSVVGRVQVQNFAGSPIQWPVGPIVYNLMNRLIYVLNAYSPTFSGIAVINGTSIIPKSSSPPQYAFLGYTADSSRGIYFTTDYPDVIAASGLNDTRLASISVGQASQLIYDPINYRLYVQPEDGNVTVLSTTG